MPSRYGWPFAPVVGVLLPDHGLVAVELLEDERPGADEVARGPRFSRRVIGAGLHVGVQGEHGHPAEGLEQLVVPVVQVQHVVVLVDDLEFLDRVGKLELAAGRAHVVVPLGHFGGQLGAVMEHDALVQLDRYGQGVGILDHALGEVGNQRPPGRELHDPLDAGEYAQPSSTGPILAQKPTILRRRVVDLASGCRRRPAPPPRWSWSRPPPWSSVLGAAVVRGRWWSSPSPRWWWSRRPPPQAATSTITIPTSRRTPMLHKSLVFGSLSLQYPQFSTAACACT